ncbi:hypothetical protein FRUB_01748 [Fimbriiglobus ruber]|uniref:Uncharacterized protein n=1 Tax=Fimbriiglobus ruber TaxID=1908690 RepID=A0A225EAI4_9BACT|nr:hypothetical protein FRUB_01748 [Fimbriiglobus ruber]
MSHRPGAFFAFIARKPPFWDRRISETFEPSGDRHPGSSTTAQAAVAAQAPGEETLG